MHSEVIQLLFRQLRLREGLVGVPAVPLCVTYCPSRSVLRSPFQILNTTQLNNSIFSQDRMGVSAEGLEDYSFNPSLKFGHWSMAGSHHDIVDLVSWIQAQVI